MIELDLAAATSTIGAAAVAVVAWGAWLSVGSSRRGPAWAHSTLQRWRWMPWAVAAFGVMLSVVVAPVWVGVGVAYIGVVSGWLLRTVRRGLERVREAYGGLDQAHDSALGISRRASVLLILGALVLTVVGLWDITVRGWLGLFGLALAVCLGGVGVILRRRAV